MMFGHSESTSDIHKTSSDINGKESLEKNHLTDSQPHQFSSIPPPVIKPIHHYQHTGSSGFSYQGVPNVGSINSRHSVLNHSVELDDILEESDCLDDEDIEGISSTGTGGESRASPQNATCSSSSPDVSSSGGNPSPEGSFRGMLPPIIKRIGVNSLLSKFPQHHRRSREVSIESSSSSKNISWCFEDADSAIVMEKISSYSGDKTTGTRFDNKSTEIEIKDINSPNGRHYKQHRIHCSSKNNQQIKSHDSGFSDSADSTEDHKSNNSSNSTKIKTPSNVSPSSSSSISSNASSTSHEEIHSIPSMQSHSIIRHQSSNHDYSLTNSSEEETEHCNRVNDLGADGTKPINGVRSEVVHETRTNAYEPHKQYHVSKVYFYSVSDMILNGEGKEEAEDIKNKTSIPNKMKDYFHEGGYNQFIENGVDCGESYVDTDFNDEIEDDDQHISILDCETGQSLLPRKEGRRQILRNESARNSSSEKTDIVDTASTTNNVPSQASYNMSSMSLPPPPPQRISSLSSKEESLDTSYDSIPMVKLDPNACDMILSDNEQQQYLDISLNSTSSGPQQYYFMEHKPLRPREFKRPTSATDEEHHTYYGGASSINSQFPEPSDIPSSNESGQKMQYHNNSSSRVYARTSSLGRVARNVKTSPTNSQSIVNNPSTTSLNSTTSPVITSSNGRPSSTSRSVHGGSGFPKTNGALIYESLSLGRPSSRGINDTKKCGSSNYSTLHDHHIQR